MTFIQFWFLVLGVAIQNAVIQSVYGLCFEDCLTLATGAFMGVLMAYVLEKFSSMNWRTYLALVKLELQSGLGFGNLVWI